MEFGWLRTPLILFGLFACCCAASCTKNFADYATSECMRDYYPEQKIFIAELLEIKAATKCNKLIENTHKELDIIKRDTQEESDEASEKEFNKWLIKKLENSNTKALDELKNSGNRDYEWFIEMIDYTGSMKKFDASSCDYDAWVCYVHTIKALYADDLDGFVSGKPKQYGKFREYLYPRGKRMLGKCLKSMYADHRTKELLEKLQLLFK